MQPQPRRLAHPAYLLSALLVAILPNLPAQDITVSDPMMFPSNTEADTPPALKKAWKLKCPEAMKKGTEHNYAIVAQYIDAGGRHLKSNQRGAQPLAALARAELSGLQCKPARADGKPVASRSFVAVIFNPANASLKAADAAPRLLAVAPAFISEEQFSELRKAKKSTSIKLKIELDASGALSSYAYAPGPDSSHAEPFKAAIDRALGQWKFAAARKGGQPVPSSLVAPLLLTHEDALLSLSIPPSVVRRDDPVYPRAMEKSGLVGEVVMKFVVDKNGNVTNPVVVRSNNPGFEKAAIESVLKWKFKPGMKDGAPVDTSMQIPITFELRGRRDAH
ncbi:MAG: energy transducer TonB [Opitutaceae bacterium]|nr:energy transducer TonB [Opitutaceae bacterium]